MMSSRDPVCSQCLGLKWKLNIGVVHVLRYAVEGCFSLPSVTPRYMEGRGRSDLAERYALSIGACCVCLLSVTVDTNVFKRSREVLRVFGHFKISLTC